MQKLIQIVQNIPRYELNGFQPYELENQGKQGKVVRVSHEHVAKFCNVGVYRDYFSYFFLTHEQEIMNLLKNQGISVPNPLGIFKINFQLPRRKFLRWEFGKTQRIEDVALVMEYVSGIPISRIKDKRTRDEARELMHKEYTRAEELADVFGIDIKDENAIYQPDRNRVVLIDFLDYLAQNHKCLGCPIWALKREDAETMLKEYGIDSKTL